MRIFLLRFLPCILIVGMLSGCAESVQSSGAVTGTEQTSPVLTESSTTVLTAAAALPADGELTKRLGEALSGIFEDNRYYFKEIAIVDTRDAAQKDYISLYIKHSRGNEAFVYMNNLSMDELEIAENFKPKDGMLIIENTAYDLDSAKKTATGTTKDVLPVAEQYNKENIPSPDMVFFGVRTVEENGKALVCEAFKDEYGTMEYYYDTAVLVKFIYNGSDYTVETRLEYSSEPDESLLTIPEDYEIIK